MPELEKTKITGDGSVTFFNTEFKEHYHSLEGAREEALAKFIGPSEFERRFKEICCVPLVSSNQSDLIFPRGKPVGDMQDTCMPSNKAVGGIQDTFMSSGKPVGDRYTVSVLDVCFGLGYNTLLAVDEAVKYNSKISVTALEIDRSVVGDASRNVESAWQNILASLYNDSLYNADCFDIEMLWGDARQSCGNLIERGMQYDLIYHDPFSTQRNAQLWTVDFFKKLYQLVKSDGMVLTYSTAIPVLVGFLEAGFHIGKSETVGEQRVGLVAAKSADLIMYPYSDSEMDAIMKSVKSIPYRDESQKGTNSEILKERNEKIVNN